MNGIPRFEADKDASSADKAKRCRPYLQIFKNAKLMYTSTGRNVENAVRCEQLSC